MSDTRNDDEEITILPRPDDVNYHNELDDNEYLDWINYIDSRSEPIKYEIENIQKEEQKPEEHEIVKSFFVKLSDYL